MEATDILREQIKQLDKMLDQLFESTELYKDRVKANDTEFTKISEIKYKLIAAIEKLSDTEL